VLFLLREQWHVHILIYLSVSSLVWLLMLLRLYYYQPDSQMNATYRLMSFFTALASMTTGWFALSWLRGQTGGAWLIMLLLLIVWSADTGAYCAGKMLGNKKLAPNISPGKTLAGLIGGMIAAPLVAILAANVMPITILNNLYISILAVLTALMSVGGDLLVSLHKRVSGHKDSGTLLPGHGGILDRLDSLLSAAPLFALGVLLMGI